MEKKIKDVEVKEKVEKKDIKKEEVKSVPKKIKKANKINYATSEQKEVKGFITVIILVLLLVGCIYLATRLFVTKDLFKDNKDETKETEKVEVNYDVAIVGNMLKKPEKEYYVLVFDSTGEYAADMSNIIASYNGKEKHLHIYNVDLHNKLNSEYFDAEHENKNGNSVDNFKFGNTTLVKVKDGKVSKYITDSSKMKSELGIK